MVHLVRKKQHTLMAVGGTTVSLEGCFARAFWTMADWNGVHDAEAPKTSRGRRSFP